MAAVEMNRRTFLVSAAVFAGGMSLSLRVARSRAQAGSTNSQGWQPAEDPIEFSAWIAIGSDDTVIVRVPTGEMGTGSMSQVPMNVTEELHCDWSKVRAEFASSTRDYLEQGPYSVGGQPFFSGHGTDPQRMKLAMQLGASARERLKAAAAARWSAPVSQIDARNSILKHMPSGRTLRYGEVAAEAAKIQLASEPGLKPQSEWTFIGKASPPKINLPEIVKGTATYGIDVGVPGMVYAALLQCPVHGGKLKHHEPGDVLKMPGVRAVVVVDRSKSKGSPVKPRPTFGLATTETQSAVAVIADHYWQAKKALEALPVEWDKGPGEGKSHEDIYAAATEMLDRPPQRVLRRAGDPNASTGQAVVEATYVTPYCDQTPIEPLNGTALVSDDKADVWHPCQDSQQALWVVVDETGLPPEKVHVHRTFIGGAFGRRTMADDTRMVVAIAKEYPGVPVKVIWSREEMMKQGRYRTPIVSRFRASLDDHGMPQSWKAHACTMGLPLFFGFYDTPYAVSGSIPSVEIGTSSLAAHVLTGAYRGPCYNSHAFMVETFVDECAAAARIDPLEYRLRLLSNWDPAWSSCLKVAAEKSGWGTPLKKGQGRGIAIANWPAAGQKQAGSTVCAAAFVEVSRQGALQVKSVDVAFDCGRMANRDAVLAQLEGGTIFGLNMTVNEEITVQNGAVVESNFDRYPVMRMGEIPPRINVHFDALSGHDRFAIIGEAPVGPVGAAVGNAIFQATGKRLRSTPFRKHDLTWS
jgi:isoquinoline 1-oxidoreductase beta subunit